VKTRIGILLLVSAFAISAQSVHIDRPFGLKSDILGESIDAFRTNNAQIVQYHDVSHELKVKHFPICANDATPFGDEPTNVYNSDNIDILVPEREAKAGVVYCSAGSWISDWRPNNKIAFVNLPTIGGVGAVIRYQFWKNNLYAIDVKFNKKRFEELLLALKTKYGEPSTSDVIHFQNGFGAKIDSQHFLWKNGLSKIEMSELPTGYMDHLTITLDSAVEGLNLLLSPKNGDKDL
jgi:hypothetical protein